MAKPIPSLERLRACFKYDAETGIFTHALARHGVKLGSRADRWATSVASARMFGEFSAVDENDLLEAA
jgi:hypothetical protein